MQHSSGHLNAHSFPIKSCLALQFLSVASACKTSKWLQYSVRTYYIKCSDNLHQNEVFHHLKALHSSAFTELVSATMHGTMHAKLQYHLTQEVAGCRLSISYAAACHLAQNQTAKFHGTAQDIRCQSFQTTAQLKCCRWVLLNCMSGSSTRDVTSQPYSQPTVVISSGHKPPVHLPNHGSAAFTLTPKRLWCRSRLQSATSGSLGGKAQATCVCPKPCSTSCMPSGASKQQSSMTRRLPGFTEPACKRSMTCSRALQQT